MKNLFLNFVLILLLLSCSDENRDTPTNQELVTAESFTVKSMETFENVSGYYPDGAVLLKFYVNEQGYETARYSLSEKYRDMTNMGLFAMELTENGSECPNPLGCGKLIKKCLDNGKDALVSNGPSATYCVTCKDPA